MKKQTDKKNRRPLIILGTALMLMAAAGTFYWIRSAAYETTDDAQIDGNIYAVRAGVTAYLKTIAFRDNQHVAKGDTLLILDTVALKAKVLQAQAAWQSAKTKWNVSAAQALASRQNAMASRQNALSEKQSIAAAKAKLDNAQRDFGRDKELLKIDAVTRTQYDADQVALTEARTEYKRLIQQQHAAMTSSSGLKSQATAARHQISAAAAEIAQREAELRLAEEQLEHAYILAPCGGIVTKRSVDEGQYILAGQSLCAVVDEEHLWITAHFKETQLRKIKPGQSVAIRIDAYPDLKLKGIVRSYGGATGAKFALIPADNATGNFIKVTQRFPLRIAIVPAPFKQDIHTTKSKNLQDQLMLFPGLSAFVKVKTD